jgi:hypothetical protein
MKNVAEALELHLRELDYFVLRPRAKPKISAQDRRRVESGFDNAAVRRAPRGRPPAWRSRDERTYQSCEAFVFVTGEMRTFKMRHGIKRIPVKVRDAFIEFAKRMCPFADEELVLEHIRKDQRFLPDFNEPTCFLLVRFEYECPATKTVISADVIVAAPSNKRRSMFPHKKLR